MRLTGVGDFVAASFPVPQNPLLKGLGDLPTSIHAPLLVSGLASIESLGTPVIIAGMIAGAVFLPGLYKIIPVAVGGLVLMKGIGI